MPRTAGTGAARADERDARGHGPTGPAPTAHADRCRGGDRLALHHGLNPIVRATSMLSMSSVKPPTFLAATIRPVS